MLRILLLLAAAGVCGCASTGATPRPFPGAPVPATAPDTIGDTAPGRPRAGSAIAGTALSLRGVPYRVGGTDTSGFDCSGLVHYVFERHGIRVPRSVAEQFRFGRPVPNDIVEPGDLVFFDTKAAGASHVGISIGGDEFVHAPASNGVVRVERLGGSYWASRFVGARRLTGQP